MISAFANTVEALARKHNKLLLLAFIILQCILYQNYIQREIAGQYPALHDQGYMLSLSYEFFLDSQYLGYRTAVREFFASFRSPTGILYPLQNMFFFTFFGVNREAALMSNMLFFFILQLLLYNSIKSLYRSAMVPWAALFVLISMPLVYFRGGLYDARLDFEAFCLYGIVFLLGIRSNFFKKKSFTIAFTVAAIYLFLWRYLSSVYLGMIYSLIFFFLLALYLWQPEARKHLYPRIKHLILSGIALCTVAFPVLFLERKALQAYYVKGHLGLEGQIRGIADFWQSLLYYPKTLFQFHMGLWLFWVFILAVLLLFINRKTRIPYYSTKVLNSFIFMAVPLVILTMNPLKSEIVVGIIAVPTLYFIFVGLSSNQASRFKNVITLLGVMVCIISMAHVVNRHIQMWESAGYGDRKVLNPMYEEIFTYIEENNIERPVFSQNKVVDYSHDFVFRTVFFERFGKRIKPIEGLTGSIFSQNKSTIMNKVKNSDFFIWVDSPHAYYPFDKSVMKYEKEIEDYLQRHFFIKSSYNLAPFKVILYLKKRDQILLHGLAPGDYIPIRGLQVEIPAAKIARIKGFRITADYNSELKKNPGSLLVNDKLPGHAAERLQCQFNRKNMEHFVDCVFKKKPPENQKYLVAISFPEYFTRNENRGVNYRMHALKNPLVSEIQ